MLERMKALLKAQEVCALATVSPEGQPHCSLMFYITDDNGQHIYLITRENTKKYRNLSANPAVSLLIDNREVRGPGEPPLALTIGGICETLPAGGLRDAILGRILARHPHLEALASDPEIKVLSVRGISLQLLQGPTSVCYAQMT